MAKKTFTVQSKVETAGGFTISLGVITDPAKNTIEERISISTKDKDYFDSFTTTEEYTLVKSK